MNKCGLFCVLGLLSVAPAAQAASVRTFVASTGVDSGACARATPCRSFAYAITQTSPAGEIDVLDSGGFGAVTITQSVSIINDGNVANIAVPAAGTGITVNAGPDDTVTLRGLTIDGNKAAYAGIAFLSGKSLTIANCSAQNFITNGSFTGAGIISKVATGSSFLSIAYTTSSNNASYGIEILGLADATSTTTVDLFATTTNSNAMAGVAFISNALPAVVKGTIVNSGSSNNGAGFRFSAANGVVSATLDSVRATGNNMGLSTSLGPTASKVFIGRSTISSNFNGILTNNTGAFSFGTNQVVGNVTDGTLPLVTPQ